MQKAESQIFDELLETIEEVAHGEYSNSRFESFMRVGNPPKIRRLATMMDTVFRQFESREHHLKIAVEELRAVRSEMEQFNARLDTRVKERTKALEEANSLLESLSTTDALTGISNRRNFDEKLIYEYSRAIRYQTPLSCIMFDIDFFKKVNDTYGHLFGDEVLKMIGQTLTNALRSHDIYARYGGEEFVVLLPETSLSSAYKVAEKIRLLIAGKTVKKDAAHSSVTISCGVAQMDCDQMNVASDLVDSADQALYHAKKTGRNRSIRFSASMNKQ